MFKEKQEDIHSKGVNFFSQGHTNILANFFFFILISMNFST